MKYTTIQPPYSRDFSLSDEYLNWELDALDKCDASSDVIVLPEYSNVPCLAATKEEMDKLLEARKGIYDALADVQSGYTTSVSGIEKILGYNINDKIAAYYERLVYDSLSEELAALEADLLAGEGVEFRCSVYD